MDPGQPTDGRPPDFDAIYTYAAQFIELGDLIYEYAHNVISDGMNNVVWSGDQVSAADAAKDAVQPLTMLLTDSDQNTKVPSAARLLWNIGESINWFAINLEEQRAQENKEAIGEMVGLLVGLFFGLLLGGLAFLPATAAAMATAMSFVGDAVASVLNGLFEGVEWLGTIGRAFGDTLVGAALGLGPLLASTVIGDAAAHLKIQITSKEIIIGTLLGAGGGVLFGNTIREAAAAAAAEKAAADAVGASAPELGAGGAVPKPEPGRLPGLGTDDGGIGGLPKLDIPRPDGLPGGGGLRAPDAPADAPVLIPPKFNPVRGLVKFDDHGNAVVGKADEINAGGPGVGNGPPANGGRPGDGIPRLPDLPDSPGQAAAGPSEPQPPKRLDGPGTAGVSETGVRPPTGPASHTPADGVRPAAGDVPDSGLPLGGRPADHAPATGDRPTGVGAQGDRPGGNTAQQLGGRVRAVDAGNDNAAAGPGPRRTAADRLTSLEQQIDAARAESDLQPSDMRPGPRAEPLPYPREGGPVTQRPPTTADGENLASRFPDAPTHEPATAGAKDIYDGLLRAHSDAEAAGISPRHTKDLSENVRTALDDGRLMDAADHLARMRDDVDRLQVGRRLDDFREHVDAGYQRPAQMGMDKVTWLEKAASIEKAAAEGRFDDVHSQLKNYERVAGEHLDALRAQDRPPAGNGNTKLGDTLQDRLDALHDSSNPDSPSTSKADELDIDQIADRLAKLRSDKIDEVAASPNAHRKLTAKAHKVDQALRGEDTPPDNLLAKIGRRLTDPEDAAAAKIENFHDTVEKAGYHAKVEALRKGDSPLPKAELEKWQKSLAKFRGWKFHEQKLMEYYDTRVNNYEAELQHKIVDAAFAPDDARPLNDRLDEQLARISEGVRLRAAAEHLSPGELDRLHQPGRAPDTSTLQRRWPESEETLAAAGSPETSMPSDSPGRADTNSASPETGEAPDQARTPETSAHKSDLNAAGVEPSTSADPYSGLHAQHEAARAQPGTSAKTSALRDTYQELSEKLKATPEPKPAPERLVLPDGGPVPERADIDTYFGKRSGSKGKEAWQKEALDLFPDDVKSLVKQVPKSVRDKLRKDIIGVPETAYVLSRYNKAEAQKFADFYVDRLRSFDDRIRQREGAVDAQKIDFKIRSEAKKSHLDSGDLPRADPGTVADTSRFANQYQARVDAGPKATPEAEPEPVKSKPLSDVDRAAVHSDRVDVAKALFDVRRGGRLNSRVGEHEELGRAEPGNSADTSRLADVYQARVDDGPKVTPKPARVTGGPTWRAGTDGRDRPILPGRQTIDAHFQSSTGSKGEWEKEALKLYPDDVQDVVRRFPDNADVRENIGLHETAYVLSKYGGLGKEGHLAEEAAQQVADWHVDRLREIGAGMRQGKEAFATRVSNELSHPDTVVENHDAVGPQPAKHQPTIRDTSVRPAETPPSRQVFGVDGSGRVGLVQLGKRPAPFPGAGRSLRGDRTIGSDQQADDGQTYFTIDPQSGRMTPTRLQPDEVVKDIRPADASTSKDALGNVSSKVTVFNPRESTWNVEAVRHLEPGESLPSAPEAPPAKDFQLLRRSKSDGTVDLLTYKHAPVRIKPEDLDPVDAEFQFRAIDGADAGWSDARAFGTPTRVERVVSSDGDLAHGVLIRDDNGQWTAVRTPNNGETIEPPDSSLSFFRPAPESDASLRPVTVKNTASDLTFVDVRTDGDVQVTKFAVHSDDLPHLRIGHDDELVNIVPAKLSADELVVNPKSGDLTLRTTGDGHDGPPSGSGEGPSRGPSGGGSGGGGLALRDAAEGSSTQTAPKRTIVLKAVPSDDKASTAGEKPASEPPPENDVQQSANESGGGPTPGTAHETSVPASPAGATTVHPAAASRIRPMLPDEPRTGDGQPTKLRGTPSRASAGGVRERRPQSNSIHPLGTDADGYMVKRVHVPGSDGFVVRSQVQPLRLRPSLERPTRIQPIRMDGPDHVISRISGPGVKGVEVRQHVRQLATSVMLALRSTMPIRRGPTPFEMAGLLDDPSGPDHPAFRDPAALVHGILGLSVLGDHQLSGLPETGRPSLVPEDVLVAMMLPKPQASAGLAVRLTDSSWVKYPEFRQPTNVALGVLALSALGQAHPDLGPGFRHIQLSVIKQISPLSEEQVAALVSAGRPSVTLGNDGRSIVVRGFGSVSVLRRDPRTHVLRVVHQTRGNPLAGQQAPEGVAPTQTDPRSRGFSGPMNEDPQRDPAEAEAGTPGGTVAPLAPDARLIASVIKGAIDEAAPTTGHAVLKAVFDRRFALGVRLKGATGDMPGAETGSDWLFTDHKGGGPGWKGTESWHKVRVAARELSYGGITLFPAYGEDTATFLYNGRDDIVHVFEVDVHGNHHVTPLDDYAQTHDAPAAVVAIDQCGEVHG